MTNNDELAIKLKAEAESATKGSWRRTSTEFNGICVGPFSFTKEEVLARTVEKRDAIFISVANPANILALLAERDADKKRIAELEAREETLRPVGVMSEKAFYRLERSESRFIALWPRPGIHLPRKRPDDGLIVYARTAAGIKLEAGE